MVAKLREFRSVEQQAFIKGLVDENIQFYTASVKLVRNSSPNAGKMTNPLSFSNMTSLKSVFDTCSWYGYFFGENCSIFVQSLVRGEDFKQSRC